MHREDPPSSGRDAVPPALDAERRAADVQNQLLERLLDDEARGVERALAEYQEDYPGYEALVARTFDEVRAADERVLFEGRERVATYVLIRELGRGGQGTVFLARDTRLPRLVALKVLSSRGIGLGGARLARFRREAAAASRLDHPALCPVYESGESDGVHFIAMRYVQGESLALHIARSAARGAGTSTRLLLPNPSSVTSTRSTRTKAAGELRHGCTEVLALFERLARALHVAHEAGVVHRDIKPGNVMVTPDGQPVLLDFGLARDQGDGEADLTRTDEVFGTPAYMAPEQLRPTGKAVDRRADVYALGVSLFESLTLQRPYRATNTVELADTIDRGPTPNPRTVDPDLPSDLSVVIATAMARDPAHRYTSALELAEELRRVRELEPILARPAPWPVHAWRWAQRNTALAASLALVVTALSLGLAASLFAYREASRERAIARDEGAHRADINAFMRWVLSSPDPVAMGSDATLGDLLDRAVDRLETSFDDRPGVRAELLELLGGIQESLGDRDAAQGLYSSAVELRAKHDHGSIEHGRALAALADSLQGGDIAQRGKLFDEALVHLRRHGAAARHHLAAVGLERVRFYVDTRQYGDAHAALATIDAEWPEDTTPKLDASRERSRAMLAGAEGRFESALEHYEAAYAIPDDPDDPSAALDRHSLVSSMLGIALRVERHDRARELSEASLEYIRGLLGETHPRTSISYSNHSMVLRMLGDHEGARGPLERALAASRVSLKAPHDTIAINLSNLGALEQFLGRPEVALPLLDEARAMFVALEGPDSPKVAGTLDNIADLHANGGRFGEAADAQAASLAILERAHGQGHYETVSAALRLARFHAGGGELQHSHELWTAALPRTRALEAGGRLAVLRTANDLALVLSAKGAELDAVAITRETEAQVGSIAPERAEARLRFASDLAVCLHRAQALDEAEAAFRAARVHLEALGGAASKDGEVFLARAARFTAETGRGLE